MKESDTIREALEVMRTGKIVVPCSLFIDGTHTMVPKVANDRECTELAIKALAALSTIDPDAKPQEQSEDEKALIENLFTQCFVPCHHFTDMPAISFKKALKFVLAHDDAIRRECADRAVKWYNEPDNQNYMEKFGDDEYWNNELRAAILGTEPAWEKSCKTCKHNGNQSVYPSACTSCWLFDEYNHYDPALGGS